MNELISYVSYPFPPVSIILFYDFITISKGIEQEDITIHVYTSRWSLHTSWLGEESSFATSRNLKVG